MGNMTSKAWEEVTEIQAAEEEKAVATEEIQKKKKSFRDKFRTRILRTDPRSASDGVDRTPIAIEKQGDGLDTPQQAKFRTLTQDPRSPGGELERTPIVVEEQHARKRILEADECSTPLRGQAPAGITLPSHSDTVRSPLVIESGGTDEEDPRSPSTLIPPRTPIGADVGKNCHDSPVTVDLEKLQLGERKRDRGQPSIILQNRLKTAMAQAVLESPAATGTPASAVELDTSDFESDISNTNSNEVSLVI